MLTGIDFGNNWKTMMGNEFDNLDEVKAENITCFGLGLKR